MVCQCNYTLHLLEEFSFLAFKPHSTPMNPKVALQKNGGELLVDPTPYCRLVGCLLYLTIMRLGITFIVNTLSQFISAPHSSHMQAATHLLRYMKSESGLGPLCFASSTLQLHAILDSDWATCSDSRRSICKTR